MQQHLQAASQIAASASENNNNCGIVPTATAATSCTANQDALAKKATWFVWNLYRRPVEHSTAAVFFLGLPGKSKKCQEVFWIYTRVGFKEFLYNMSYLKPGIFELRRIVLLCRYLIFCRVTR